MKRLGKRLGENDAHAVDLLLDKAAMTAERTTAMYATLGKNGGERRVRSVASILKLLEEMPAEDPPADLVQRTMERVATVAVIDAPASHAQIHANPQHPDLR